MAIILYTWQLGGGLGHIAQLLPIGKALIDAGHQVIAAVKDVSRTTWALDGSGIRYLQAPLLSVPKALQIEPSVTFAHILHNTGFAEPRQLEAVTSAWRTLCECVGPDLILFDHSPAALLATGHLTAKRVVIGTGFFSPPDETPLPDLRPWLKSDPEPLRQHEAVVLDSMNSQRRAQGLPPFDRVTQLYSQVDDTFFMTFAELDHFPRRQNPRYYGILSHELGESYEWPSGGGPRVYAYLKPFPALAGLLKFLEQSGYPTIILSDGIEPGMRASVRAPSVRFAGRPLDLKQVAAEADLIILNANHGTLAQLLLAGKPSLQIPLTVEQHLLAKRVVELGAGLMAWPTDLQEIVAAIERMLASRQFSEAARRFAMRYRNPGPETRLAALIGRIEELLWASYPK